MKKLILVDGNNLLFRSYYATAYSGNFMNNSKGFPTNALFGFANMMNKIINEEKPEYIIVAFDKGKTFRHEKYDNYKSGRMEAPVELIKQFPVAKEMLTKMGIKYYEIAGYEADDIIGTFAKYCDLEEDFVGTIISSDKDLLQLLSNDVDIKLLKQKDYIRYSAKSFSDEYKFHPKHMIDLKALMGDSSDNIKGVKGIGEKTALKLIAEYHTLDNIYNNIENIKGSLKEKLKIGKEDAYISKDLVTIIKDVPMEINIYDLKYLGPQEDLNDLYNELEFYSFIKKNNVPKTNDIKYIVLNDLSNIHIERESAIYIDIKNDNYHNTDILGVAIYNDRNAYYIPYNVFRKDLNFLNTFKKYTYDSKKLYTSLKWHNINLKDIIFDTQIAAYLLDYNIKDDIAYLANIYNYDIPFKENIDYDDINIYSKTSILKAKFIYEIKELLEKEIVKNKLEELFYNIEMPLAITLGNMEYNGVCVDKSVLNEMGEELKVKISLLEERIYNHAGHTFNISSPKQLGEVLFNELNLTNFKKTKTGYSTNIDVLNKLKDKHPIINLIIEYRGYTKLYSTYIEGLKNYIMNDNKIHTIYTNTLTKTGRLSSIEPNLQNIPARSEEGKQIRKAFIPSLNSVILSSDYSQIELRILSHMANIKSLIEAFNNDEDIHTKTAKDLLQQEVISSNDRRIAKAVNFGIIYGISAYGLSENTGLTPKEATDFIATYFKAYPGVKEYMDNIVNSAKENGYVKTLFGRIRHIEELKNKNILIQKQGERMALNTPIQGTSADIIKKAMVEIDRLLQKNNMQSKMILQVHDELVFDAKEEELEQLEKLVNDTMVNVIKINVPLKVEISKGNNWYLAK